MTCASAVVLDPARCISRPGSAPPALRRQHSCRHTAGHELHCSWISESAGESGWESGREHGRAGGRFAQREAETSRSAQSFGWARAARAAAHASHDRQGRKGMDGRRDSARTRRMPAAPASPRSTRRPCPSPTATESTVVRFRWWRKAAPRSARLGAHCRRYGSTAERHAKSQQLIVVTGKKGAHADHASPIQEPARRARAAAEVTDRRKNPRSHPKPPTRTQPWSRATSALLPPARSSQPTRMAGFGAKVDMVRTHEQQPTRRASLFRFAPGRGRAAPRRHTRARS
jgi:hypothetical protein